MRSPAAANVLLSFWVGSIWSIGYIAVPVIFATLEDKALAGSLAGQLFTVGGGVGLFTGALLALTWILSQGKAAFSSWKVPVLLLALLLLAVNLFGVQPVMVAAHQDGSLTPAEFALLHRVAGGIYMVVSVLALGLAAFAGHQPDKAATSEA